MGKFQNNGKQMLIWISLIRKGEIMKPEIKYFYSPDIEDLKKYSPKQKNNFSFLLQVIIGVEGMEGEESFDFEICTPHWLLENYEKNKIIFGRGYIIVFEYNLENIIEKINKVIDKCKGGSWDEIANKINLFGRWEFDNYIE